jgi:hypothetical protein
LVLIALVIKPAIQPIPPLREWPNPADGDRKDVHGIGGQVLRTLRGYAAPSTKCKKVKYQQEDDSAELI